MKTVLIIALFSLYFVSNSIAQKIDYSVKLAYDGLVHTNNSTVIDKDGNIFVAGGTKNGLQITEDAFQKNFAGHEWIGGGDIYLMKLSPDGELLYSTYIGGSKDEYYCNQIAIDVNGNVYIGFTTNSSDLPVSNNAYQKSLNGSENDHYIIKFSNDCKYISSTYLGGSGSDHWTRLAINNNVLYLVGCTKSLDFPVTEDVIQEEYNNWTSPDTSLQWLVKDITITALSLNLEKIYHSTFFGGDNYEGVNNFRIDPNGKLILAGVTNSNNFPITKSGYNRSYNGNKDGFISIIDPDLSKILYSTLLGGKEDDKIESVAFDKNNIILVGDTKSPDFPVTDDAISKELNGTNKDGFITKLNTNTNELIYSSYLGGPGGDQINEVRITKTQELLLVGVTGSKDFPTTENALYKTTLGGADLVLLKLDQSLKNIAYSTYIGGTQHEYFPEVNLLDNKIILSFTSTSKDFPFTNQYAQKDTTNINALMKIDLIKK